MTIEIYNLALNSAALAIASAGLWQEWKRGGDRAPFLLALIAATIALIGGQLVVRATRDERVERARQQLASRLGELGRPFEDLQIQMPGFSADELRDAIDRAEGAGDVHRVPKQVRDIIAGKDYTINVLVPVVHKPNRRNSDANHGSGSK